MKQLTKKQIQELYKFTKARRVRHYDVQTEVVDHLASAIEGKWVTNPDLSFEKALNQVYAGFGIFGFGKLEQEKTEAINAKLLRKTWTYVKSFLTIPKIFLTILLIVLLYNFLLIVDNAVIAAKWIGVGTSIFYLIFLEIKRRREKEWFNNFLEIKAIFCGIEAIMFLFYFNPQIQLFIQDTDSKLIICLISVTHILSFITCIGMCQYWEQTLLEVKQRYAHYQMV